jgi:hypothetical protein
LTPWIRIGVGAPFALWGVQTVHFNSPSLSTSSSRRLWQACALHFLQYLTKRKQLFTHMYELLRMEGRV